MTDENRTHAPTDETAAIVPTDRRAPLAGADAPMASNPLESLDAGARSSLRSVADHLIPAAHGMPSAGAILDDERLRFVLRARPDLIEPLSSALRPELGADPHDRITALEDDAAALAALQLVIVAGYYTDAAVRERIGYPGQLAIPIDASETPAYVEEGLIDNVIVRGAVWRDPSTGERATEVGSPPDYSQVFDPGEVRPGGGHDGNHGS